MTAANSLDAEHAEIGDREAAALELLGLQLAVLGARGEVLHLGGDLRQALDVGVADDRRDQAAGRWRRRPRCRPRRTWIVSSSVHEALAAGTLRSAMAAGLDDEVVDRELWCPRFSRHGVDRLARRQQRVDLAIDRQIEMRDGLLGLRAGAARSPCASMVCGTRVMGAGAANTGGRGGRRGLRGVAAGAPARHAARQRPLSMSALTMRPCGPLPLIRARSSPPAAPCAWRAGWRRCARRWSPPLPLRRRRRCRRRAAALQALQPALAAGAARRRRGAASARRVRGLRRRRTAFSPSSSSTRCGSLTFTPSVPSAPGSCRACLRRPLRLPWSPCRSRSRR